MSDHSRLESGDWLEAFLFDRRMAVLRGTLDDGLATRVATELMTFDATGDDPVTLQVDCSGGTLTAALTLVDVIEVLGVPVEVLCMGRVEGVGVAVVATASSRRALAHTQFKMGDPELSFEARAGEVARLAAAQRDLLGRYHQVLAQATKRTVEEIERWCARRSVFDASEAMSRGIVDEILRGKEGPRSARQSHSGR